jgi:hypothetical protein
MCLAWLLSAAEGSQLGRRAPGRLADHEHPLPERIGAVGVVLAWQRGVYGHVAVYRR